MGRRRAGRTAGKGEDVRGEGERRVCYFRRPTDESFYHTDKENEELPLVVEVAVLCGVQFLGQALDLPGHVVNARLADGKVEALAQLGERDGCA